MEHVYKVEIVLDEDKLAQVGKSSEEVCAAIDKHFQKPGIMKDTENKNIVYYSDDEEKDDSITAAVMMVYLSAERPYIKAMTWHNKVLDSVEDVLEEVKKGGL